MRKFIVILIILIIVAAIVGIIFALVNSSNSNNSSINSIKDTFPISLFYTDESPSPYNGLTSADGTDIVEFNDNEENSSLIRPIDLSHEEIYGFWVLNTTSTPITAYFLTKSGEIKKNDGTGVFSIASYSYGAPLFIKQNKTGNAVVVKFDSGYSYLYVVSKNAWEALGNALTDVAFSQDGTKLIMLEERVGETSLVQYEPFSLMKKKSVLSKFKGVDFRIQWPSSNNVVLSSVPSYFSDGSIIVVNLQKKTFNTLAIGKGIGVVSSWNNTRVLVSKIVERNKTSSAIYSLDGKQISEYSIMILSSKCGQSLSDSIVFCGSPRFLPEGYHILPDDYLKKKIFTHDELIGISLDSGELYTVPFGSDSFVDISSVVHAGKKVFYIDRLNDMLYQLDVDL